MDPLFIILIAIAIVFGVLAYTCSASGGSEDRMAGRDRT